MSSANNSSCNRHITEQQSQRGNFKIFNIYRPQRSWGKVMFLHVSVILLTRGGSASVHAGIADPPGSRHPPRSRPPGSRHHLPQCMLGDMANKRVVCILLECNLVTGHNEVVPKVIFLRLFVILFTGGVQYPSMHRLPPEQTPPPQSRHHTPGADTPW